MTNEELMQKFEDCTLPAEAFHHEQHVRLAWLYLCRFTPLEALARFSDGLKRFAASLGKANRYHETITWAYLLLIHERMGSAGETSWEEFAANNPDLLNWQENILKNYYREETLRSDLARRLFVFPDKGVNRSSLK